MLDLLKKAHENDVKITFENVPYVRPITKVTMRSGCCCLARYISHDNYTATITTNAACMVTLHNMLDEFIHERDERLTLVKEVVNVSRNLHSVV